LIAVPLAAAVQILARRLWVEEMDRTGVDPKPPPEIEQMPERRPGPLRRALGVVKRR